MNENKQIQLTSSGLFLLGIYLIVFSYNKLYLSSNTINLNQESIGLIKEFENEVRLKKSSHFEWLTLKQSKNTLNTNDRIFTNQGSTALIKLNSGHEINVSEQTLLRINDNSSINIERGNLEFTLDDNAKPFEIILNKKKYKIKANKKSTITISKKKSQDTTIKVNTGDIEIKAASSENSIQITKEQELDISKNSTVQKISLISPINEVYKTTNNTKAIRFDYSPINDNDQILIARDMNFKDVRQDQGLNINVPKGVYFWKVNNSQPEMFKVLQIIARPKILNPENDQVYILFDQALDITIKTNSDYQQEHIFELFDGERNLIKESKIRKNNIIFKELDVGEYYLRAKLIGSFEESYWSEMNKFIIKKYEYDDSDAVVIELAKPDQRVRFEWEQSDIAKSLFEVAEDPSFSNIRIKKNITKQNHTFVNFSKIGKYYWRARKVKEDGSQTIQKPVQVIIKPAPPLEKPKDLPDLRFKIKPKKNKTSFIKSFLNLLISSAHASTEFEDIIINVPAHENVKSYNLEIYSDITLENKVTDLVSDKPSFTWSPPTPGDYFWRLQYIDFWDQPSEFSEISKMTIIADLPPVMPEPKPIAKAPLKKEIKPKTRIIKKEKKKKQIVKKRPKERRIIKSAYFHIGPSSMKFSQQDINNFEINGQTYNSYQAGFETTLLSRYFSKFKTELSSSFGEVYEGQEFYFRRIEFMVRQNWFRYFWLTLDVKQIAQFKSNLGTPEFEEAIILPNIGLRYEKAILRGRKSRFTLGVTLRPVLGLDYNADLTYQYYYKRRISIMLRGDAYFSQQDFEDTTQKIQYFSVLTGVKYYF